jgi:hypothetical protein
MNPRYKHFQQEDFTAGDYEQFVTFLSKHKKEMKTVVPQQNTEGISLFDKLFEHERWNWSRYRYGIDPFSTFEYIYNNFKKGVYVQIVNNKVNIMLPFSNVDFKNKYADSLAIDSTKFQTFEEMYKKICELEGRHYLPNKVSWFKEKWYCNNGLVRYEYPIKENDSGINMIKDMLNTLCEKRIVPDCEFFIHKRDFPLISLHGYDPYTALVPENTKMAGFKDYFLPVLSMCSRHDFADIPIPTWEDWCRASYQYDKRVFPKANREYPMDMMTEWLKKKPTVVFRGSSTGLGNTIDTNPRFFFSKLCQSKNQYWEDGTPLLDIGITKWNIRPRKQHPDDYLDIPDPTKMGLPMIASLNQFEQSEYKYILHLPGHSCAYRLSQELGMMSVIFLYPSNYHLWFFPLLIPFVHYIPLIKNLDENEIFEKIRWCEENPEKAEEIAKNAFEFYKKYLSMDSILDFMQKVCIQLSTKMKYNETHYQKLSYDPIYDSVCTPPPFEFGELVLIKETRNTRIYKSDDKWLIKEKDQDMRHSFFVSHVLKKELKDLTSNFMYSSYIDGSVSNNRLIMPYDKESLDMTLETFLKSDHFTMREFKNILCQIIFSLQISQIKVGFIHYDLTPWNIILLDNHSRKIVYPFYHCQNIVKNSKYFAKIIDFEYAHVYYNEKSVHNILPFFLSGDHDILTLVYNSFSTILKHQKCIHHDVKWIEKVLYYCTDHHFLSIREMKSFLMDERKFSRLLLNNEKNPRMNIMSKILESLRGVYTEKNIHHDWIQEEVNVKHDPLKLHRSGDNCIQLMYIYRFHKYFESMENSFLEIDNSSQIYSLRAEYERIGNKITFPNTPLVKKPFRQDCSRVRWHPFIIDESYIPRFDYRLTKKALLIMCVNTYVSAKTLNDARVYLLELSNE